MENSTEISPALAANVQTDNVGILSLVNDFLSMTNAHFTDQCVAIYIMGSLSRGGFSEYASDIDLGIIVRSTEAVSDMEINRLVNGLRAKHSAISNNVSVFWGSIESINGSESGGRYPPFDRLDLIEHATLLWGRDVRSQLSLPSQQDLEISCVEFAIEKLATVERIQEFFECQNIANKGIVYVTKTVLFPARFIYLLKAGVIAGNEASTNYYVSNFILGPDALLVNNGYQWRVNGFPARFDEVAECLQVGLVPLYVRFIDLYIEAMRHYDRDDLVQQLQNWKQKIELSRF